VTQVTETKNKFQGLPLGARAIEIADGNTSNYFLTTFGRASRETVCSCEVKLDPTLSQSLHMLNGATVGPKITQGAVVARMLDQEKRTPAEVIENIYLRCFSRPPTPEETKRLLEIVQSAKSPRQGLEDVFWAVLNAREFLFNH
jgi:hypothetical protein